MVYCGKPSTACKQCRVRRIKCDERRPSCTQCRKVGKTCTGYRDQLDLLFRNETDTVVKKAGKQQSTAIIKLNNKQSPISLSPDSKLLPQAPSKNAINFFLFAFSDSFYNQYVPQLYQSTNCPISVEAGLEAVSLACVANEQGRHDLLVLAREKYGVALQATNTALQSPKTAGTNETLASVMLLAFFSALVSDSGDVQDTWAKHINGALAILSLAPTEIKEELLDHVLISALTNCIQRERKIPPALQAWYLSNSYGTTFQRRFWGLLHEVFEVQAGNHPTKGDVIGTINVLRDFDGRLEKLMEDLEPHYRYEVLSDNYIDVGDGILLPDHHYRSHRDTQWHNPTRMLRIAMYNATTLLVNGYLNAPIQIPDRIKLMLQGYLQDATDRAYTSALEICACVPHSLRPGQSGKDTLPMNRNNSAWAYCMMWPLSLAGACPLVPKHVKKYIHVQQKYLQNLTGIWRVRQSSWNKESDTMIPEVAHVTYMC